MLNIKIITDVAKNVKKFDGFVALGCVIKGETPHFDIIASESANGLSELSRNNDIPVINGIITTDNREQALKRSQIIGSNKGWDEMDAAFKVISIYRKIQINEYKRRQAAPGLRVSSKAFGVGRRIPIVNHFKGKNK